MSCSFARPPDWALADSELRRLRAGSSLPMRGVVEFPPVRDPVRAAARAAQLILPSSVISHTAAARLEGLQGLPWWQVGEPVDATVPAAATRWQRRGVRLHFMNVSDGERADAGGIRVTKVGRTLEHCVRFLDRPTWISLADSALHQGLITQAELKSIMDGSRFQLAAAWTAWCDALSESPSETRVRLVLVDAGFAPEHLQHDVYTEGGFHIARLDMAWTSNGRKVGLEVDSREHDRVRALYRDRERLNALRQLGWDVRQVTAHDEQRRPRYIVQQVAQALGLA